MSTKNTIIGIIWGSLIGSDKTGDIVNREQLLEYMRNTLTNGKFYPIEYCQNIKKIIDDQIVADKILVQVLNHEGCKKNPTRSAEDIDRKFTVLDDKDYVPTNAALIRAIPAGFFDDWVDRSILSTMCTHMNKRCIASGLIISSIIRERVLGLEINLDDVIPETLNIIHKSKQMDEKEFKKLAKFALLFKLDEIKKIKKPDNYIYISLLFCLRSFSFFLNNGLSFEEGMEFAQKIISEYDLDPAINLSLIGGLFGCEVGYDNLPMELMQNISDFDEISLLIQEWTDKFLSSST